MSRLLDMSLLTGGYDRAETLAAFEQTVFGVRPELGACDFRVESESETPDYDRIDMVMTYLGLDMRVPVFLPKGVKSAPAVVHVMHPYQVQQQGFWDDPDCVSFPVKQLTKRGYAFVALIAGDVAADAPNGCETGIFTRVKSPRGNESWGVLSAWAWGASRAFDFLSTLPRIDAKRISVAGHSRGGKTALWAAATDTRFYAAFSSCSGNSGAALSRGNTGESVADITKKFDYWFCPRYQDFANNENALPFDQHQLLGLIAPRKLYVSSATDDAWADPDGELLSAMLASQFYIAAGGRGLVFPGELKIGHAYHDGDIGYHRKKGPHSLIPSDWDMFIDFLEH